MFNIWRGFRKLTGTYRSPDELAEHADFSEKERAILAKIAPFTMTSAARGVALMRAVEYTEKYRIPGAFVECGVWKGGSVMAMAERLNSLGSGNREIYLYDTFEGMSEPTGADKSFDGRSAISQLSESEKEDTHSVWCYSTLEEVKSNIAQSNYPMEKLHFIKGKVEDTIPATIPEKIALLRLDTDWYESTKHELTHLFPLLVEGGVIIIDDYGHWEGCRKAVDEYFEAHRIRIFLSRIDYTGRIGIKQNA